MSKIKSSVSLATKLIHAGEKPDPTTGSVAPVLVRSKTYQWKSFEDIPKFQYLRGKNPTKTILEEKIAGLESLPRKNAGNAGEEILATCFGSGVAAEAMLFLTLSPGDHIIFCQEVYGGSYRLIEQVLKRFGLSADYVDFTYTKKVKSLIRPTTRYFFVETPTNPSLHIVDLEKVGQLSKETGIPFIVDATFSPPVTTNSFAYGAETVIYSLSKYYAGHNDALGGAVVTRNKKLDEKLRFLQGAVGAALSPDECYRIIQGLKTLELRFKRASESAQKVAEFLAKHPAIAKGKVFYPGLPSHQGHDVACRQMTGGFGSVVSFVLKNEMHSAIKKFVERIIKGGKNGRLITYGESLASPETILAYPALMSHKSLPSEVRKNELGISDGFFRLSLGLEDPDDIIQELKSAISF